MSAATLSDPSRSRLTARIPQRTGALLAEAAALRGLTLGSFVVAAAVKEAEEVLARQQTIRLTREDARKFFAALDRPPAPGRALRKAAAAARRLIRE